MRPVLVSGKLSISTYVVKRLKIGLLLEMNVYDFEIGFTHWRSRFVFLVHLVEKYSFRVGTESVLKAVGSSCQLWARAQAVKETGAIGTWCTVTPRALL